MLQNLVDYKAKSFLSERKSSSIAYEVKAVRALWDPSLSIPGTNRRGGWRCPVGTRYGGQITDRFGRQCGWGAARRIANMISDVGSRLERADDGKRGRRIARREQRMIRRLAGTGNGAGRIERGLRGVAERLDGGDSSTNVPSLNAPSVDRRVPSIRTPEAPRELTPARPVPGARVRRPNPNLRDSEARRMEREIAEPGAPRTGEAPARPRRPARARRPRGENNLRESEQRRMDREIEQPGAPRTDERAPRNIPARPQRRRPNANERRNVNLLAPESDEVLQDMRREMEADPDLDLRNPEYQRVLAEILRRREVAQGIGTNNRNNRRRASDANASEDFAPYVNRKYDEYARNVRLLNENNKPAGMMTRRQWYAVNEDNLREAWGNAHGREAPRDFIPPTPRRRQRANRRRDAVVDTAKAPKARKVPKVLAEDFDQLDRDVEEARDMLRTMQQNNATPARIRQQKAKIRKIEKQIRDLIDQAGQENGANRERNLLANEPDDVIRDMINEMVRDPDFDEENPEYIRALAEWNRRQNLPDRNAGRAKPRRDPSGQSDNAARSEELRQARSEAARQAAEVLANADRQRAWADEVLANADRQRAFAMDDPEEFANAFMPSIWNQIAAADRQEFRDKYRDERRAIDDVLRDLEQQILDEEFGDPDDLRERIDMNNEEIRNAKKRLERDLQVLKDLEKPAPLERQRVIGQNRRDALSRIAVNAPNIRRRELENNKFEEAIDIAAANKNTPKSKKPKNSAEEIEPKALAEVFDKNGIDVFDVLGIDRLEVMNNIDNFPGRSATRTDIQQARIEKVRQDANRRVDGAIAVRKRLQDDLMQGNINKENYVMFARGGESQQRVGLVEIFRRLDEFQEAWEGIIGDLPEAPAVPNPQDALGFDYIGRGRLERLFGVEEAKAYEAKLNREIGRLGGDNMERYQEYAKELTPERLSQFRKGHIAEISNLTVLLRDELNNFSRERNRTTLDDAFRREQLRRVTNINAQIEKAKRAKKIVDDEINVREGRARANRNTTGSKTPAAPKAPVAPKAQIARLRADVAEAERNLDQLFRLRADVAEAERNLDHMERNGARDVVMRKERARRDDMLNQIASLRDKRPRDADGAIITDQTPEPKAPVAPKAPAINPTEAPVQVNNVPMTLRPAVRPSHKGVLENDQKEIAGQQVLARRGTDAANFALLVDEITLKKRAEIYKANLNLNRVLTSLFTKIDAGVDINAIKAGETKSPLRLALDGIDALSVVEKRQFNEANLKQKLDEMRNLINVDWEELQKLTADAANAPQYKTRLGNIAKLEADIVRIENHFWLKKNVEDELRKAKTRKDQGLNIISDEAVGTVVVDDNIKNQFKDAISRRNNKLVQYLDKRHADGSPRPYEDMTTAKWDAMSDTEKRKYLTAAYSHKKIAGANGKFYQIRVESITPNGPSFNIVTKIDEITEDGRVLRSGIGNSNRTVYSGRIKYVDMRYLKLDNPIDKGADIATIYNQHAFLYLSKMGAQYAEVHPAWDGPYVWARAGYRNGRKFPIRNLTAFEEGLKFYENFGPGGIISSDKEYRRVKKMLEKTRLNPNGVYEAQDWIFAIDDTPGDPIRRTYIKDWYLRNNITIGDAKLDFAREEIGKNLGKKRVKKAARPRAARPRARVF